MSRRILLAALATFAVAGTSAALPSRASAVAPVDDVMLDDVGPGWVLVEEQPGRTGALTRTWRGDGGDLTITGFAVTTPPGVRTVFDALARQPTGFEGVREPSLELGTWLVPEGDQLGDRGFASLFVASRNHVFGFTLTPTSGGAVDPVGFVLALASKQIEAAGGSPAPDTESEPRPAAEDELLRYLPGEPPPGYRLGSKPITVTGKEDVEDLGFSDPEVNDFLDDRAEGAARAWPGPELSVGVGVTRYPYDLFASAKLGRFDDAGREVVAIADPELADAISTRDPGRVTVVFRRGDLLVTVLADYRNGVPEDVAAALAVDMARLVDERLPAEGGTAPYDFPSPPSRLAGLALTAGFVTAAVAGSTAIARLRARRVRRRWAVEADAAPPWPAPGTASGEVVDLDEDAAALRRRGRVVAGVQLLTVNIGVVALAGDFAWAGVIVAAAAMLTGVLFSRWWLQREHALLGPKAPPRAFVVPRFWGAVMGLLAFAVLGIGVSYMLKGTRYVLLDPTLAQLRWSDLLGLAPRTVGVVFAIGGLLVTVIGAMLWRVARTLGRARVREALRADPRPPVLYLRSFGDDSVPLPTIASARRPLFELFSLRGADPFEEAVAWELDSYGPVVAVGRPGRSLASLGAAREHLPQDTWRAEIAERMRDAAMIALAPGETAGLAWELGAIVDGGHVGKTVFVFPPLAPGDLTRRWDHTSHLLVGAGTSVGPLPVSPATLHTVRIDEAGALHVTTATMRDEATYRVAVDRALEPLASVGPAAAVQAGSPVRAAVEPA